MADIKDITPVKTKDIKDYRNPEVKLNPTKESTKRRYFGIYEDYSLSNMTEKQIAEKYKLNPVHVSEILKWVASQLGNTDNKIKVRAIVDRLRIRQQDFEDFLTKKLTPKEAVLVHAELRKTDRLIAEMEGVLSTALIDMSDRRQVNMHLSDKMKGRRGGTQNQKTEAQQQE